MGLASRSKTILATALILAAAFPGAPTSASPEGAPRRLLVLYQDGVSSAAARAELQALGADILAENDAVGLATIRTTNPDFVDEAMATGAFFGVSRDRSIGTAPPGSSKRNHPAPRHLDVHRPRAPARPAAGGADPLFRYEWHMRMIHATPRGSYSKERGDKRVLVGVMDTGIDLHNPDLRTNVDKNLSKTFLDTLSADRDKCKKHPKSRYCGDSPFKDTLGHGTAVGSVIAGAINGSGISGVAPKVTLVSLRVGRYYVFVQPVVDALTYAADHGIDIVNMSFFVDPWLFNCPNNSADTNEQQMEQRTIVKAIQDAIDYARGHEVTPITAMGNEALDLGKPKTDTISPDYPAGANYHRDVDNSCLVVPQETDGVIGVSALGPSKRKAYYSDYGIERTDVSAPAGDDFDNARHAPMNQILVATSKLSLEKAGLIDNRGKPKTNVVMRRCREPHHRRCDYFRFWQGTSFASPVAAGVAALIVSRSGTGDGNGGLTMAPSKVQRRLLATATEHRCPKGRVQGYKGLNRSFRARCDGSKAKNGFYGAGIVDALRAVRR
jgi:subtilisin family serine protease